MSNTVELKAVQAGVRANFTYVQDGVGNVGFTEIQLTITDQAEVDHISGDIPLNTTSGHGAMTKTIYVDAASTSAFAILESGVSPDFFDFVAGATYNVVTKFGVLSQVSTYTHTLPPVSDDYSTVISHGNETLTISLTAANNNSAGITNYLVTIMGNDKNGSSATFQKLFPVDVNGNINVSVDGTGSEFGLAGFVGKFQNGLLLEIVIAAQNDAGYQFESVTYHASPTSTANEPTLTINSGLATIDVNNPESDEDLFVKITPGVQIANAPDLLYLLAINNQPNNSGGKLYKRFDPSDPIVQTGELLSTDTAGWTVQTSGIPVDEETETPLVLVDGTEYTFDCWAENINGKSPPISTANTGIPSGLPAQPTASTSVGSSNGVASGTIRVTITNPDNYENGDLVASPIAVPNSGNTLNNGTVITDYKITVGGIEIPAVAFPTGFKDYDVNGNIIDATQNSIAPFTDISGLTNGTDYGVSVIAVNANGDSTSFTASNAKPRTDPSAPTFTGGNDNAGGAAFPVQGAASILASGEVQGNVNALNNNEAGGDLVQNISYVFELSKDINFTQVVDDAGTPNVDETHPLVSDNAAGVTQNTFSDLVDGTLYYMRVKAVNNFSEASEYTNLGSGDPFVYVALQPNDKPNAPQFVANSTLPAQGDASTLPGKRVKGTVGALANIAAGGGTDPSQLKYTFELDTQADFLSGNVVVQQGADTVVEQLFTGLTNGTLYYIRAKVTNTFTDAGANANGRDSDYTRYNDANGNAIALQPNEAPIAPTFNAGLTIPDINTVSTIGSQEVKGTVNALADTAAGGGSDAIKYTFEICDTPNFGVNDNIVSLQGANNVVDQVFTGLTNGTSYYIRAKATNEFGTDSPYVNYDDGNGTLLALVPSTAPTINTDGLNDILLASVKNTFIDSANNEFFTVNMANIVNSVNNGGYPMTEIVVTATGNDTQSVTIALADIAVDKAFDAGNALGLPATNNEGANNAGFLYTLSVSANNAVYTTGNTASSSTSTVHMTNTKLIASSVSASLGGANGDAITFSWQIPDFASLNEFTNGTGSRFDLQLQEKIPTEDDEGNIAYPAEFYNVGAVVEKDINGTVHANGFSSYSHEFTGLRYGTIYSVAITTNSKLYDVNPDVSYSEGPVNDATGVVPHTKPTIEVASDGNGGNGKIVSISSNGSLLETTFALDSSATNSGITDLTTLITNSTVGVYAGGNPPFTLYNDVNGNEASLKSTAAYTPAGGANFLIVTENNAGASISLNGNPLGLSN